MLSQLLQMLSHVVYLALHVVHSGSFPKPLSKEEEMACWIAYREQGDPKARDQLIEHNLRLVAHIIRKYYSASKDQDDLISIGTIGLMKAVSTFDYTKGPRLATYAARYIENEILMYFRASKRQQQEVSISEPIDVDKEGNPLTLMDVLVGEDSLEEDTALREQKILALRYGLVGNGLTQREVAKKYQISRSYVSRIEKKALEKLRARFEAGDVTPRPPTENE